MTYLSFLFFFLVLPIGFLILLLIRDRVVNRKLPPGLQAISPYFMIGILITVAVLYTTPWDNYLVATGVWWYDPTRVLGIVLGWVPIEEYTFFVLQPIFTGLLVVFLARRLPSSTARPNRAIRGTSLVIVGVIWVIAVAMLISDWQPGTYLAIELAWALPPILLQLFVGASILWKYRRVVVLSIVVTTLYLSAADSVAISTSIWTIDPEQSLNILIGGKLPVEEFVFFALTNTLVVFGLVLGLAEEVHHSLQLSWMKFKKLGWKVRST